MKIIDNKTVAEAFHNRVSQAPDSRALVIVSNDGSETLLTYQSLGLQAQAVAQTLLDHNLQHRIVMIALPFSEELIIVFWGCICAGVTAHIYPYQIPSPAPELLGQRIAKAATDGCVDAVWTSDALVNYVADHCGARVISKASLPEDSTDASPSMVDIKPHDIAYLQYTSGTSGMQKGVMLSHQAILAFVQSFSEALGLKPGDCVANWLPLYHDGGLFEGLVVPVLCGVPAVLMSPFKWIRNPSHFFKAVTRHKATIFSMPNFAYNHAVRAVRSSVLKDLDLSSVRYMINSAEPVLDSSHERFFHYFRAAGLKESALGSGYGFAENTLAVTLSQPGVRARVDVVDAVRLQKEKRACLVSEDHPHAKKVVSCGVPSPRVAVQIRIAGQICGEREMGEIVMQSPSLFSGYYKQKALVDRVMKDGWFYTGDTGYLADNQLFVCGRTKDLIIVGGRNIHPEDIEQVVRDIKGLYPDRIVAFGVMDEEKGTERVILIADIHRNVDDEQKMMIEREIRKRVLDSLDLVLDDLRLMPKGWVIKTPNGKISRSANRDKYGTQFMPTQE